MANKVPYEDGFCSVYWVRQREGRTLKYLELTLCIPPAPLDLCSLICINRGYFGTNGEERGGGGWVPVRVHALELGIFSIYLLYSSQDVFMIFTLQLLVCSSLFQFEAVFPSSPPLLAFHLSSASVRGMCTFYTLQNYISLLQTSWWPVRQIIHLFEQLFNHSTSPILAVLMTWCGTKNKLFAVCVKKPKV